MIAVRDMEHADIGDVLHIFQAGIDTGVASFRTVCPSAEEWNRIYLSDCRRVVMDGSAVVGWAALLPYSGMDAYRGVAEVSLYIDPQYRGRGIGLTLLDDLSRNAQGAGFWSLQSKIIEDNRASIGLHEKAGFRVIGRHEGIAQDAKGRWHDTILMEKRLQS